MGLLEPDGRGCRLFRRNGLTGPRPPSVDPLGPHPRGGRDARGPETAPVITIHSLAHAVAVLNAAAEAGRAVVLASPPDAGIYEIGRASCRERVEISVVAGAGK